MKRSVWIGLGLLAGVVGAAFVGRKQIASAVTQVTGSAPPPAAKQWEFDRSELQMLMGQVVREQAALVAAAESPAERNRAAAFQRYYEGRLAAVR